MRYSSLIDTVKLRFMVKHKPFGPEKFQEKQGGFIQSRSGIKIYGPHGVSLDVRSVAKGQAIELMGSINKFGNGQNLAGSEDLPALSRYAFRAAFRDPRINIDMSSNTRRRLMAGDIDVLRVDLTAHADLGSLEEVMLAQKALLMWFAFQGKDFSNYGYESLYLGWNSQYWTFKTYVKELEMKKHAPQGPYAAIALEESIGLLRLELSLLSSWLLRPWKGAISVRKVSQWTPSLSNEILKSFIARLNLDSVRTAARGMGRSELEGVDKLIFRLYQLGDSLEMRGDERWYSRHRKSILEKTGVDISIPIEVTKRVSETYDIGALKGKIGFGLPEWARNCGLIATPVQDWEAA